MDNINEEINEGDIAVIGMSGRFPGAKNIDEFWQNLKDGVESIRFFSEQELIDAGIEPSIVKETNYVKAKGILDNVAEFDAAFFGLSPKEAEITDPQQRLFLECAWEALENAGYDPQTYSGAIGLYGGMSGIDTYLSQNLSLNPTVNTDKFQLLIGNDKDFLCTRIAYKMNLTGPSITVQTACSTALVAVAMAYKSLLTYQCDMVLAGGVAISLPVKSGYFYQEGMILSPDGHCRAFDAKAQGTVQGNGVGLVVLKRLEEAIADKDHIYAVIRGTAINNDGNLKVGYTAPSVQGQVQVIAEALAMAETPVKTIGYIETHGTGTVLGDPIEIAALTQVFQAKTDKKNYCAIGSVKTNIGHLDTAAGIAGFIKTVLAIEHQLIPPSLHFDSPNPKLDLDNSPFYVNTTLSEWKTNGYPRRAGVSAFGIGGTNAHVILEEAPQSKIKNQKSKRSWQLLLLSAKTDTALETATIQLVEHFKQYPNLNLADVAYTYQVGRHAFNHRRMLVCQTLAEAINAFSAPNEVKSVLTHTIKDNENPSVVFMFSGQGAQYVNMGLELYQTEPLFRQQVDRCTEYLKSHLELDLRTVLYPNEAQQTEQANQQLKQTAFTQPAIFVIEYALAQLWMAYGIQPKAMIGHSIGEYVAACLAGVFTLEDALMLVAVRGQLMQSVEPGAMLAVPLSEVAIQPLLNGELDVAAINLPTQCVVSGTDDAVTQFAVQLAGQGIDCQRLQTSHAFHSEMMSPILIPFLEQVQRLQLKSPQIPFISNVTGTWISNAEATDPNYWVNHIRQTVRFAVGLKKIIEKQSHILLEIGPGRTLSTLAKQYPDNNNQLVLTSLRHPKDTQSDSAFLLTSLGQLWLTGITVNWAEFHSHEPRYSLPLPTYPFERQHYWIESEIQPAKTVKPQKVLRNKQDIADWFYIPSWKLSILPKPVQFEKQRFIQQCWLVFIDECGLGFQLVKRLEQEEQDVISVKAGQKFVSHNEYTYTLNPEKTDDYEVLLKTLRTLNKIPKSIVHLWCVTANTYTTSLETLDKYNNLGFYSLLFLAQALGKQNFTNTIQMLVVSNNTQEIIEKELLNPDKATMLGAVKVIPLEYPNINCRSIDIVLPEPNSQNEQRLIEQLWQEFTTPSVDIVIAYRDNQRWIQTFEPIRLNDISNPSPQLKKRGVYLITGGLGAMGLTFSEYLAKTVQAKLVLIGRSTFPPKDEWRQWLATHDEHDSVSKKIHHLQTIENFGAEVLVLSADVANYEQMQTSIAQAREQFGQINGVIHAAGIADYAGIIQNRTREISDNILAPKVRGTLILDNLLKEQKLDFLVLCSSMGSTLYKIKFGQISYAAATEFLDAFTYYKRNQTDQLIITINWSDWEGIGMSWEAEKHWANKTYISNGQSVLLDSLLPQEGVEVFKRILKYTLPRVIVLTRELSTLFKQMNAVGMVAKKTLENKVISNQSTHSRPKLRPAYVAPRNNLEQTMANIWQAFFNIETVGIWDDFFELGGDSLLAVQLISQLRNTFQIDISPNSLLDSPTIVQLAELITLKTSLVATDNSKKQVLPFSLVEIKSGIPDKISLFLMHQAGGTIYSYRELANYMAPEQPIYGLQAQGIDGKKLPLTQIEEMASHYIKALRVVQPTGPYCLGGASFGGTVAYEMAQQLHRLGEQIALLTLMDSACPGHLLVKDANFDHLKITAYALGLTLKHESFMSSKSFMQLTIDEQVRYLVEHSTANNLEHEFMISQLSPILHVIRTNEQALENYVPKNYLGRILFFRARDPEIILVPPHPEYYWSKLVNGGIDFHEVPGNHFTMHSSPHVKVMANLLRTYIEKTCF